MIALVMSPIKTLGEAGGCQLNPIFRELFLLSPSYHHKWQDSLERGWGCYMFAGGGLPGDWGNGTSPKGKGVRGPSPGKLKKYRCYMRSYMMITEIRLQVQNSDYIRIKEFYFVCKQ